MTARPGRLSVDAYVEGVLRGDRAVLARAITLVESERPEDAPDAAAVLDAVLPHAGHSHRVGITGVPGVGKSTFIDALGMHLVRDRGERVAVLSVDPSSPLSGGSILGDKTRMERLALEDAAYIRPSPSRGVLGGVARRTRETILLCEAAGFGTILVETVGVGQSETAVRSMTDFFLLLMLPGAGDELQGIKRGIIEMVDAIAINKADGDMRARADRARVEYRAALHLFPAAADGWAPPVLTCSALAGDGIAALWDVVGQHRAHVEANGFFARRRSAQSLAWMRELVGSGLEAAFRTHPGVAEALPGLEAAVAAGRTTAFAAARDLLARFRAT
ncbi:ATPase/protein kinase [Luteitalea sp. TBR-22]|uniref:methylmalonyl Co-A mutase-associated GTPase MeaB n=1 Tax=Luteitalea sp. TBR-22 TaxID=2802971 RepID=UPI001AF1F552|nr:methylmalonyl Co-A mutase-associated GTPase MeaB [Luteitalea sp. TBR-22]BCS34870.1 ATPase/protein kinase [Luteitalea sp. TBR-22]